MSIRMNKQWSYNLCVIVVMIICNMVSCKQKTVNQQQLEAYIAQTDHGLIYTHDDKRVKASVKYKPFDFLVDQQLQAITSFSGNTIDSLRGIYAKNLYFVLHLTSRDQEVLSGFSGDAHTFSEMVEKLSFDMGNYVSLTTEKGDTLQMVDFVYPRMYGMSGSTDIMFAFENKIPSDTHELSFNLSEFGLNIGKMKFTFTVKDIISVPKLTFTKNNDNKQKQHHNTANPQ